jgi:hypothetical protein
LRAQLRSTKSVNILLRNCRKVIPADGRLLLFDWVMPTGSENREEFRF